MEYPDIWTPERQALAMQEAESWRGTPHAHRIASRGRGIDCIRFVVRVLVAAGVVEPTSVPTYPTAWGLAAAENRIGAAFLQCCDADRIPVEDWQPRFGDICIWRSGRNSNHCGIFLGRDVWHVSTNSPAGPLVLESARRHMQEAIRLRLAGWTFPPSQLRLMQV